MTASKINHERAEEKARRWAKHDEVYRAYLDLRERHRKLGEACRSILESLDARGGSWADDGVSSDQIDAVRAALAAEEER